MVNVFETGDGELIVLQCAVAVVIVVNVINNLHLINGLVNNKALIKKFKSMKIYAVVLTSLIYCVPVVYQIVFTILYLNIFQLNLQGDLIKNCLFVSSVLGAVLEFVLSYYVYVIFEVHMTFLRGKFGYIWLSLNVFQFILSILLQSFYSVYAGPGELVTWGHISNVMSQMANALLYTYVHYRYKHSMFFKTTQRFLSKLLYVLYFYFFSGILMVVQIVVERTQGHLPLSQFFICTALFHCVQAYLVFILLENFFPFCSPFNINFVPQGGNTINSPSKALVLSENDLVRNDANDNSMDHLKVDTRGDAEQSHGYPRKGSFESARSSLNLGSTMVPPCSVYDGQDDHDDDQLVAV